MATQRLLEEAVPTPLAIIRALEGAGVEYVFGMSGGDTGKIVKALTHEETSIELITVKHESLGSVMAEVYGRLRGKPGVLLGQGPWAMGLGILGILEAKLSSSPLIILADFSNSSGYEQHGVYQVGMGSHGAWDARQSFGGITKHVFDARTPVQAVQSVQFACKHALTGERGPVAVLFATDSLDGTVGPETEPVLYNTGSYLPTLPPPAKASEVQRVANLVAAAERPVIIAGNGVRISGAEQKLAALAEAFNIPVATSAAGKGTFAENDPLALGVFGNFGTSVANAAVGDADLVLAVGTKLGASDTARENKNLLNAGRQTVVQIDIEPLNASWTFPSDNVLVGDAGVVLDQLRATAGVDGGGRERIAEYRGTFGYFDTEAGRSDETPIMPERVIAELQAAAGTEAIITCDAGENRIFMTHFFQTQGLGSFIQAPGCGPMGFGIPAALAAKLLHPDRPVVTVTGDGGFAMTMNGLLTAIEYELPVVVLILNNASLGWVVHGGSMPEEGRWRRFDFAAMAEGMGCQGISVDQPQDLAGAFATAFAETTRPTVIDVTISHATSFRDVTSELVWGRREDESGVDTASHGSDHVAV